MMASSNPEDWINYADLLQGPYANQVLEIVNRRNTTDCPYCIDMLTMDEAATGMCETCRKKKQNTNLVVDLTDLTSDEEEEYVPPVNIYNHELYNSPMHHSELDHEVRAALTFAFADMVDFEYYPKDMAPDMGGSFVAKRKREKSPEEQKKAQAQANEKRRKKDAQTNYNTLRQLVDGFQDITDQVKDLKTFGVPSQTINALVCKVDNVENFLNNLKLRSKI